MTIHKKLLESWRKVYDIRQARFWRAVAIGILLFASLALMMSGSVSQTPYIGRLAVEGIIYDDRKRTQSLKEFMDDDHSRALIVHLNTPGGSAVGGESLYHHFRIIAERKPVVIVMHELATSAGYMAALGGNHIIAREQTITGSVGAIFQSANIQQLLHSLGIKMELFKSGSLKASPNPYETTTPEAARHVMEEHIDETREFFLDLVAKHRQLSDEERTALAKGQTISGKQALEMRLIDGFGGEIEAIAWLEEQDPSLQDLPLRDIRIYDNEFERFWRKDASILNLMQNVMNRFLSPSLLSLWSPSH